MLGFATLNPTYALTDRVPQLGKDSCLGEMYRERSLVDRRT
jgi:hypothetical protein